MQYILGEEEDVVLITASGVTTPITSIVPIFSALALRKCQGVLAVSPETLSISILSKDSNFPVTVRGITSKYLNITKFKIKEGIDIFETNLEDQTHNLRGAVIGRTLAQVRHLKIGDSIELTGTLSDSTVELEIVGILEHNSQGDSEILVPLWAGQVLIGADSESVTLIRVHFDPDETSKDEIRRLMDTQYNVRLEFVRGNATTIAQDFEIYVYDTNGKMIPSLSKVLESSKSFTNYSLPLGIYNFTVNEKDTPETKASSIELINKDMTVIVGPTGLNNYTLGVQAYLNENPFSDARVTVWSGHLNVPLLTTYTNQEGKCDFILPEQDIYISVIKDTFGYASHPFSFNRSQIYTLNLNCSLHVKVIWANYSFIPIAGAFVHIYSPSTNWEKENTTNLNGTCDFILAPGIYTLVVTKDEYQRVLNITIQGLNSITVTLGSILLTVYATDGRVGLSANISIYENSTLINSTLTNDEGWGFLELMAGVAYNLTADYKEIKLQQPIMVDYSQILTLNFFKTLFEVKVVNITTGDPIPFCKVTVFNFEDETERNSYTNSYGQAGLVTSWGKLRVFTEKNDIYTCRNFTFSPTMSTCYLFLGVTSFNMTINDTKSNGILKFIRVIDQNVYSFNLDGNSNITIELEADTYTIAYSNASCGFFRQEIYINGSDLGFQVNSVSNIIYVVNWFNSSSPIPDIPVRIIDTINGYEFSSTTDKYGKVVANVSPGVYEISTHDISERYANKIVTTITEDQNTTVGIGNCVLYLTVWNSLGNETIPGVNITLTDINGLDTFEVTNENGLAIFDIPVQEYELNATYEKDGQSYSVIQTIDSFYNKTLSKPISIGNIFTLRVGVLNPNSGYPLYDESIQINLRSEEINKNFLGGGLQTVFLPSSQYYLTFIYNSTILAEHYILLNKSTTFMESFARLSVLVGDRLGLKSENATITILSYPTNQTLFETQTNELGVANFYLASSPYVIKITGSTFPTEYIPVIVQFDTEFNYQIGFFLTISCISPNWIAVPNVEITLKDLETGDLTILNSDNNGIARTYLRKEEYLMTVLYENSLGFWNNLICLDILINVSIYPFIWIKISPPIDLKIVVQNEFQIPIARVPVSIVGELSKTTKTNNTDINGEALFRNIPWDSYVIQVGDSDVILNTETLINATTIMVLYPSDESLQSDVSRWVGHRKYAVENPAEYVGGFLESSFSFLNVILLSFVALITSLVFLSFGPIVSHPIIQSKGELKILKHLGTNLSQRRRIFLFQLSLACVFASFIGSILGLWAILSFERLNSQIIGGIAITPIYRPEIILIIVLVSLFTTIWNIYRAILD